MKPKKYWPKDLWICAAAELGREAVYLTSRPEFIIKDGKRFVRDPKYYEPVEIRDFQHYRKVKR